MEQKKKEGQHCLMLENRKHLVVTGVRKVMSFEAKEILLETMEGNMKVKGQELLIKELDLGHARVEIEGFLDGLYYLTAKMEAGSKGLWERIFK